jgi:hypothetical protein
MGHGAEGYLGEGSVAEAGGVAGDAGGIGVIESVGGLIGSVNGPRKPQPLRTTPASSASAKNKLCRTDECFTLESRFEL